MTLAFTIGPWGGIYCYWGFTKRICVGWMAITFLPVDLDSVLGKEIHPVGNDAI